MITLHYWNWDLTCVQILFLFEHRSVSDCCNILCTIVRNTFSALVHNSRQIIFSQFNVCVFYVLFVVYWTVESTTGCINCYTCTVFFFYVSVFVGIGHYTAVIRVLCCQYMYTHLFRAFVVSWPYFMLISAPLRLM